MKHQVEMIWHQARRNDRQLDKRLGAANKPVAGVIVDRLMKDLDAAIGAIEDVVVLVCKDDSRWAWHAGTLFARSAAAAVQIRTGIPRNGIVWLTELLRCGPFC